MFKMSQQAIITFDHVSKVYSLQKQKTFKEFLPALASGKETKKVFTALNDISFEIQKGESVGIVGPNGSGKSTILKLIAGVTAPTTGTITVHGKVSPLIELGSGMHPELSGRENVFLNGAILGLSQRQIHQRFKEIVDFAELWDFVDEPIKHYSSGMFMRLAFSVAIHVDPEILLVDEILAVGDASFQEKCFKKMDEFKKNGVTILLVSHNKDQTDSYCTNIINLNNVL